MFSELEWQAASEEWWLATLWLTPYAQRYDLEEEFLEGDVSLWGLKSLAERFGHLTPGRVEALRLELSDPSEEGLLVCACPYQLFVRFGPKHPKLPREGSFWGSVDASGTRRHKRCPV